MTPKRYSVSGQSGGRGADVWVVLTPKQVAWLGRNEGGSLTVMSKDDETVRISNVGDESALRLPLPPLEGRGRA